MAFKFTNFFFMLMFVLQCSDANSQIPQGRFPDSLVKVSYTLAGKDNIAGAVVGNENPSATEIKFNLGSVTLKEPRIGNILGRKMMKRRVLMEMENAKEISSKNSVAISCNDKGEQKSNPDRKRSSRKNGDRRAARKFKLSSFMALNADYHPPKSHAPKNN